MRTLKETKERILSIAKEEGLGEAITEQLLNSIKSNEDGSVNLEEYYRVIMNVYDAVNHKKWCEEVKGVLDSIGEERKRRRREIEEVKNDGNRRED